MDFVFFCIIFIPIILIFIYVAAILSMRSKAKELRNNLWQNQGYQTTKQLDTLYIDDNKKSWYVIGCYRVYKYSDILDFSVNENGVKYKSNGGVLRAVAGGAMFGAVGAIVGASTAKTSTTVNTLTVDIIVRDQNAPLISMYLLTQETSTSSLTYKNAISMANQVIAQLTYMKSVAQDDTINYENEPNTDTHIKQLPSENYNKIPKVDYIKIEGAPKDYVVFSIETSGMNCVEDDILEIGAIKYNNGSEIDRFQTYIRINKMIPQAITNLNGISNETIKYAPLIRNALKDFLMFIEDYPLITFNADFDMTFIQYKCQKKLNTTINNGVIDSYNLAKTYLPKLYDINLVTVKNHFGLDINSYNAINDCFVINYLYQYCRQFEELKYRYIIPFSSNPQELTEKEIEYVDVIVEIFEKNGIKRKSISMCFKNSLLVISVNSKTAVALKADENLQYVLLDIPFDKFESDYNTTHRAERSSYIEGDRTKVFIENFRQLWEFEPLIIKKFKVCSTK